METVSLIPDSAPASPPIARFHNSLSLVLGDSCERGASLFTKSIGNSKLTLVQPPHCSMVADPVLLMVYIVAWVTAPGDISRLADSVLNPRPIRRERTSGRRLHRRPMPAFVTVLMIC